MVAMEDGLLKTPDLRCKLKITTSKSDMVVTNKTACRTRAVAVLMTHTAPHCIAFPEAVSHS
jgi:hypothetical protein